MKKKDVYSFKMGLDMATFQHPRVAYAVTKNKRLVKEVIADMEKFVEESDELKKYNEERESLAKIHAEKDEAGNPKMKRVSGTTPQDMKFAYIIPSAEDKNSKYSKAIDKLQKQYKEAIEEHDKKIEKYNKEFLEDESDFEPFQIELSIVEEHEKVPQQVMDLIFPMIKA